MKKLLALTLSVICSLACTAQESTSVEMADAMRANGKIYVVVAVLTIIFIGIVIYLVKIDKKLTKLERENTK